MIQRLPNLPFLPSVPPQPGQAYAKSLNQAIGGAYQLLARSIDGQILTGTGTTLPGASGLRRFYFNGTTLYMDNSTTSWVPIQITSNVMATRTNFVGPEGCYPHGTTVGAGPGVMVPALMPIGSMPLNISSLDLFVSTGQASAVGSSQAKRLTVHAAIYASSAGSSMTLISSTSTNLAWTVTGASFAGTGVKRAILPWTLSLPYGPAYHLAIMTSSSSSGNNLAGTHSLVQAVQPVAFTFSGNLTVSTSVASAQMISGYALRSASTSAFATGLESISHFSNSLTQAYPLVMLRAGDVY